MKEAISNRDSVRGNGTPRSFRETPGAVVIGGDYQGLGIVRSLSRAGVPVVVVDCELSISRFSRYPKGYFIGPSARDEHGFIRFLQRLSHDRGLKDWVLYPTSDEAVAVISRNKSILKHSYRVPTPGWDVVKYFYDKRLTFELASSLGVDIPKTLISSDQKALRSLDLQYPAIIKPAIKDHFYPAVKSKAIMVNSADELIEVFESVATVIDPSEIVIQELIPGGSENQYSFGTLFKDGKSLAGLTARRTRQHPMDFGHASTYVETIDIPELRAVGERILAAAGYHGLAEVEFKYDARDGTYKFLEVNARTWGWHSIGARAGVDFPHLLCLDLAGENVRVEGFKTGVKWVRFATDFPTVVSEAVKRRITLRDYLSTWIGDVELAVFSVEDPLPFFAEFLMAPYLYKRRGF